MFSCMLCVCAVWPYLRQRYVRDGQGLARLPGILSPLIPSAGCGKAVLHCTQKVATKH